MTADLAAAKPPAIAFPFLETLPPDDAGPAFRRLASNLAHNVNNALTGVIGYLELALQEAPPGTTLHGHLCISRDCALDIAKLIRRLVGFVSPHRSQFSAEPVSLGHLAEQSVEHARQSQVGPGVTFTCESSAIRQVLASRALVAEALDALIQNAREALPKGGAVTVRTWEEDHASCVAVADTGEGIPLEMQAHLFEPFYTTKLSGHLGLGLAICRSLVEAQGGAIRVHSGAGEGTTVVLTFPRSEPTTPVPE